jgi:hypothetical protein
MRTAIVFLVLLLSACAEGTYGSPTDGRLATRIERSYAARDACLARNAGADDISNSDPATIARAIALACAPETEKLVETSNRDGDPRVASAIRKDSEFRAMGYVLRARGQVTNEPLWPRRLMDTLPVTAKRSTGSDRRLSGTARLGRSPGIG